MGLSCLRSRGYRTPACADTIGGVTDPAANGAPAGYSAGERLAGVLLGLLALGLLFVAADLATGGRVTGLGKRGCGCPDDGSGDGG